MTPTFLSHTCTTPSPHALVFGPHSEARRGLRAALCYMRWVCETDSAGHEAKLTTMQCRVPRPSCCLRIFSGSD